jgi:hypothetical protein
MICRNDTGDYEVVDNKGFIVGTYRNRDDACYQCRAHGLPDNEISRSELRVLRNGGKKD